MQKQSITLSFNPFPSKKMETKKTTITVAKPTNKKMYVKQRKSKIQKVEKSTKLIAESKQDLIMNSLTNFFQNPKNLGKMLPILQKTAHISLRVLDWFVTNYAKGKTVEYYITKDGYSVDSKSADDQYFNVFLDYKQQLKAYSKQQFDPFCRKYRKQKGKQKFHGIDFYYTKNKFIETTVGQLNFFRWIIEHRVLDYVINKLTDIMTEMLLSTKKGRKSAGKKIANTKKKTSTDKIDKITKPKKVSVMATKRVTKRYVEINVRFD